MSQRDLAVVARQQVEAEHGDRIDDHQAQLQLHEVADQAELAAGDGRREQEKEQKPEAEAAPVACARCRR